MEVEGEIGEGIKHFSGDQQLLKEFFHISPLNLGSEP